MEKKRLGEEITELLIENETKKAVGDGWRIHLSQVAGRKKLNEAALEDAGIDLEEEQFWTRGQDYPRLTVTAEKQKSSEAA